MTLKEKFYEDLLSSGILYISGQINGETVEMVNRAVTWLEATGKKGTFYFDSRGGSAAAALDCYDRIRTSSAHIVGIVTGAAFSAAAIAFMACQERVMLQHSEILFHNSYPGGDTDFTRETVDAIVKYCNDAVRRILIDRTDLALDEIEDLCERGEAIASHQARELTLIERVITTIP